MGRGEQSECTPKRWLTTALRGTYVPVSQYTSLAYCLDMTYRSVPVLDTHFVFRKRTEQRERGGGRGRERGERDRERGGEGEGGERERVCV